jgi:hypothetical protein
MGHRRVQPLPVLRKLGALCLTHRAVQGMLDDALSRLGISLLEQKRTRHGDGGCPRCMHGDARTVFVRDVGRKNYEMQREKHVALAAGQEQRGLAAPLKGCLDESPMKEADRRQSLLASDCTRLSILFWIDSNQWREDRLEFTSREGGEGRESTGRGRSYLSTAQRIPVVRAETSLTGAGSRSSRAILQVRRPLTLSASGRPQRKGQSADGVCSGRLPPRPRAHRRGICQPSSPARPAGI